MVHQNPAHLRLERTPLGEVLFPLVVLMTGKMTPAQKQIVASRSEIRVNVVIEAIKWLSQNNKTWQNVDVYAIQEKLRNMEPTFITETFEMSSFIKTSTCTPNSKRKSNSKKTHTDETRQTCTKNQLIKTVAEHRGTRHRTLPFFKDREEVEMQQPNGTARSIVDWASKSRLDDRQKRTFEILTSTFVQSFYDEATTDPTHPLRRNEFMKEHNNLKRLSVRNEKPPTLIAFIHGPGGSGKSTIVDLVKLYCEEFCGHLKHPFTK